MYFENVVLDNSNLKRYVERFFWIIEKYLDKIDVISFDAKDFSNVKVGLVTNNLDIKKLKEIPIEGQFGTIKFSLNFVKEPDVKKVLSNYYIIHDPKNLVRG